MSEGEKKQAYLLSKKGRPVLIGVVVVTTLVLALAMFMVSSLAPENEAQNRKPQGTSGTGNIKADRENLRPDITSENLTPEQQRALDQYNEQAGQDTKLHPVPTVENVKLVGIPKRSEEEPQDPEPAGLPKKEENPLTYKPTPKRVQRTPEVRSVGPTRSELEAQKRRQEAALEMLRMDGRPASQPTITSTGFERVTPRKEPQEKVRQPGIVNVDTSNGGPRVTGLNKDQVCEYPAVKGGDIVYANNELALNSDYQGAPVKVTFLSGELRNWVGMGSYATNEFGEKMMVRIERVIDPDGNAIQSKVNGYVLDPDTTLWAVASDVDRHLIYRYGGLGLSSVLKSFGTLAQARSVVSQRADDDTVVNEYREPDSKQIKWTVAGEIGGALETAFADHINRPITIKLDQNEEVGVLFENTVCLDDTPMADKMKRRAQGRLDPVARAGEINFRSTPGS